MVQSGGSDHYWPDEDERVGQWGLKQIKCENCDGEGEVPCDECDGTGKIICNKCEGEGGWNCNKCINIGLRSNTNVGCKYCGQGHGYGDGEKGWVVCNKCDGKGNLGSCVMCDETGIVICPICDGEGWLNKPSHEQF